MVDIIKTSSSLASNLSTMSRLDNDCPEKGYTIILVHAPQCIGLNTYFSDYSVTASAIRMINSVTVSDLKIGASLHLEINISKLRLAYAFFSANSSIDGHFIWCLAEFFT